MQVTETSADGLKRELKIVIPAQDIEDRIDAKLKEVGRKVRVPGFRPGKVPQQVLRQRFGDAVKGEALEEVVSENVSQTLTEKNMRPATQPNVDIEKFEEGEDLELNLSLELLPDIEAPDHSKISLTRYKVKVPDSEVEDALNRIAEQQKQSKPVETKRKAKTGDIAVIDFTGKLDGEPFEGGAAEDYPLELGAGGFIPGFEEQLEGVEPGEETEVTVTFPDDYGAEHLAGKEVVFDVKVKELREPVPAEINEELAKNLGQESLDDLRKLVREQIERDYEQFTRNQLKRDLLDALAGQAAFEVPPGMVDAEFEQIWHQYEHRREQGEVDEDEKDKSEDDLKAEYREIAERRVRLGLLLSEIGNENNIQVTQDEVGRAMMQEAQRYPGQEQQVMEYFRNNEQAMQQLRAPIFEDKVVDFILELASVEDKEVSPEELMKIASGEEQAKDSKKSKKTSGKSPSSTKKTSGKKQAAAKGAKGKSGAKSGSKSGETSTAKSSAKSGAGSKKTPAAKDD